MSIAGIRIGGRKRANGCTEAALAGTVVPVEEINVGASLTFVTAIVSVFSNVAPPLVCGANTNGVRRFSFEVEGCVEHQLIVVNRERRVVGAAGTADKRIRKRIARVRIGGSKVAHYRSGRLRLCNTRSAQSQIGGA